MVLLLAMQVLITACGAQVLLDSADRATGREHPAMQVAEAATATTSHRAVDRVTMQRFERANRAITAEEWSAAIEELHWLVENRGDLSGPCLNLALVYQYQNTPEEAEKYYRQALQVNPSNLTASYNYAGLVLKIHQKNCCLMREERLNGFLKRFKSLQIKLPVPTLRHCAMQQAVAALIDCL